MDINTASALSFWGCFHWLQRSRLMGMYPDSLLTTRWEKVHLSFVSLFAKLPAAFTACAIAVLSSPWLCSIPCACLNLPVTGLVWHPYGLALQDSPVSGWLSALAEQRRLFSSFFFLFSFFLASCEDVLYVNFLRSVINEGSFIP